MQIDISKLRPIRGRLLGKLNKEDKFTESGLELPEGARRTKHEVTVISIGEPNEKNPWPEGLKAGDILITCPYGGKEIIFNRENYVFLIMDEIDAIRATGGESFNE